MKNNPTPLIIRKQGSFMIGGSVQTVPSADPQAPGQTLHGDHAYVFYQIPENMRTYPLVFMHGNEQSKKTWETTYDGRDGFQNIFLRKGYSVYLVDQPRRGEAGKACVSAAPISLQAEQAVQFSVCRLGIWPDYYPGSQFPQGEAALDQFFRSATPNTGPFDLDVVSDAYSALVEQLGSAILVSHSRGGGCGWDTVLKSPGVKGVVSFEPGSNCVFPEGDCPEPIRSSFHTLAPRSVPMESYLALTRIPIAVIYGDNIPAAPSQYSGPDLWRASREMSLRFVDCINRYGGDARFISLPDMGIHGNTHMMMSDLNNLQIADIMEAFLEEKGLA